MADIKLKRDFKQWDFTSEGKRYIRMNYDYYTEDKKWFVKKENGFILYDRLEQHITEFKTLKEVRECIAKIKSNPFKFIHESYNFNDYIERCKNNISYYSDVINKKEFADHYSDILNLANKFKNIAENEGLVISKSPYSTSFYAHDKNENISWKYKPNNSYRFADHWNWNDAINLITHCPTVTNEDYGLCICQYINGYYNKI